MWYWRQENSQGLTELALQADQRGHKYFAEYCRKREQGLRENAFEALGHFISEMRAAPIVAQREFVDWLLTFCFYNVNVYDANPDPLKKEIVAPTIAEWVNAEPANTRALRWSFDERAMLVAARQIPPDQIAIGRYAMAVLSRLDFNTHELPHGYLGQSLRDDLADAENVVALLHRVPTAEFYNALHEEALLLKLTIRNQLTKD